MSDSASPWTAARQASMSFTNSQSLLKLMFLKLVMPLNHLILLSLSPPAFRFSQHQFFSNESVLHIRWPKYWSSSFGISPSHEYSGLISYFFLSLSLSLFLKCIYLSALGLSCLMWVLVPWPGIEPRVTALETWSLSHWTTREAPVKYILSGVYCRRLKKKDVLHWQYLFIVIYPW